MTRNDMKWIKTNYINIVSKCLEIKILMSFGTFLAPKFTFAARFTLLHPHFCPPGPQEQ